MATIDRLLEPRTRLASFLACLVLSMTCGAGFLLWIEPQDTTGAIGFARSASYRQMLRDALTTEQPLVAQRWHSIMLEPRQFPAGPSGRMLAAVPERGAYHFLVELNGGVTATSSWYRQRPIGQAHDTILVCLVGHDADDVPSDPQWSALLALLDVLSKECRADRVRLGEDGSEQDTTLEAARGRLLAKLRSAGVLG